MTTSKDMDDIVYEDTLGDPRVDPMDPWRATCNGCGWPIKWAWRSVKVAPRDGDTPALWTFECMNCQPKLMPHKHYFQPHTVYRDSYGFFVSYDSCECGTTYSEYITSVFANTRSAFAQMQRFSESLERVRTALDSNLAPVIAKLGEAFKQHGE